MICIEKYFKIYHQFPTSISDPNDCSTMPFSMSDRHNETSEFEAGCPGAVSGKLISKEIFFGVNSSKNKPKNLQN